MKKRFYFVPLQTRKDFQLTEYSDYNNIEEFIEQVIHSFANNAPSHTYLVIKHHPMERGIKKYSMLISRLAKQYGLKKRIHVVYDIKGLSCKDMKLDEFWKNYKQPSRKLFNAFRKHVISKTQLNCGFCGKFPDFMDK